MELSSFISYSLNNHLVISIATYSEGIYTADMCTMKVGIVGDMDEQTGEHTLYYANDRSKRVCNMSATKECFLPRF